MLGIRRDEEGSRSKERVVSPRVEGATWAYREQLAEVWQYFNLHLPDSLHLRVHPILGWTELDVWEYIRRESLEVMPLYFSNNGKRYRSLGCAPCTGLIDSEAGSVEAIIEELRATGYTERQVRAQDKADNYAMQKLRSKGYM